MIVCLSLSLISGGSDANGTVLIHDTRLPVDCNCHYQYPVVATAGIPWVVSCGALLSTTWVLDYLVNRNSKSLFTVVPSMANIVVCTNFSSMGFDTNLFTNLADSHLFHFVQTTYLPILSIESAPTTSLTPYPWSSGMSMTTASSPPAQRTSLCEFGTPTNSVLWRSSNSPLQSTPTPWLLQSLTASLQVSWNYCL